MAAHGFGLIDPPTMTARPKSNRQNPPPETPSLIRRRRPFLAPLWLLAWPASCSSRRVHVLEFRHHDDHRADPPRREAARRHLRRAAVAAGRGARRAARADVRRCRRRSAACEKIYVTDTRRTQQTAAGVAQRLGLTPEIVDRCQDQPRRARAPRAAREPRRPRAGRRSQQHGARDRRARWRASMACRPSPTKSSTPCTSSPCPPSARRRYFA